MINLKGNMRRIERDLDILLVMAPSWGTNMPPLGLEYINAYLHQREYSSEVFDMSINLFSQVEERYKALWNFENHRYWVDPEEFTLIEGIFNDYMDNYVDYLLSLPCRIIGFSINAGNRLFTFKMIRKMKERVKKKRPLIMLGGPLCRFDRAGHLIISEFLEVADMIVVGEGEETVAEIISYYKENKDISPLPGLIPTKDNSLTQFVPRTPIKDLNKLPFPCYQQEDILHRYTEKVIPLLMSRGCLGRCSFCDARFFQPFYRIRDVFNVVEEIKHHIKTTGIKNFTFNDLAINWDLKRLEHLCDLVIDEGLDIIWNASATIHNGMSEHLFKKMKRAGCSSRRKDPIFGIPGGSLVFGLESGSDKVLKLMNKRYTSHDAERILKMSHEAGINTVVNFIVGFPGEGDAEFEETLQFLKRNKEKISRVGTLSLCYVPEFSELKSSSEKFGIIFPEFDPQYHWHDSRGNNFDTRKKRTIELVKLASRLGIPPLATTLNYGKKITDARPDEEEREVKTISENGMALISYAPEKKLSDESGCTGILLVMPPPWGVDVPPLSIACLSSFLRSKGFLTEIFDFNIGLYNSIPGEYKYLWSMNYGDWWHDENKYPTIRKELDNYIEPLIEKILRFPQNVIGFSLPTNCPDLILEEIVRRIKEKDPGKIIILGGVSISINEQRKDLLRRIELSVDYCVVGEGEEVLYELLQRIFEDRFPEIESLQGVLTKEKFYDNAQKARIKDWDRLSFPTFEEFDLKKYTALGGSLPVEFSRGCVGNCPFCDFKSISSYFKTKSPQYILNQIRFYLEKYKTNHLTIVDPSVNSNVKNLEGICDLLIDNNINIRMSALAIPRKEMSYELLCKMKEAGFYRLEYGVESGSNRILKSMRKIFTAEIAEKAIRDTYKAGMKTFLYLIVGYPGETEEDLNETKEFLKRNDRYITMIKSINPLYIMAGSEISYNPQKYSIILPPKNSDREWYIGDENTYDIRKKRILELKMLAKNIGISFTEEAESLEFTLEALNRETEPTVHINKEKADIILTICPAWDINMPPLGIAYLSRYLRLYNFVPMLLDLNIDIFNSIPAHLRDFWDPSKLFCWTDKNFFENSLMPILNQHITFWAKKIVSASVPIIGFSVNRANLRFTIELAKLIKKLNPYKIIIFGGHACSIEGERKLVPEGIVDILVLGEGEQTLDEILNSLNRNQQIKEVPGCTVKKEGAFLSVSPKEPIKDLDSIPYPDFSEFNLNSYQKRMLPLLGSRGCLNRCSFCNDWVVWPKYRFRSAENIFGEIMHHIKTYNITTFEFVDLALNNNLNELERLCDLIIDNQVKIKWIANFTIKPIKNPKLFDKMRTAGCVALRFGIESGSDRILKRMNKIFNIAEAEKVLKQSYNAKIENHINIIVGFPGENENDFSSTLSFIERNKDFIHRIANVHPCYLTPETEIERNYKAYDIILPKEDFAVNWHDKEGNTYEKRKDRALKVEYIAKKLNIQFDDGSSLIFFDENLKEEYQNSRLAIKNLEEPTSIRRDIFKLLILIFVSFYTFFYIVYFWVYMILRNRVLLGGRRK